jgi:uncharacterized membrane protein
VNEPHSLKVLLAGESWMTHGTHVKGFSSYTTGEYTEGHQPLRDALVGAGVDFHHVPNHLATEVFPRTAEELRAFDVVILSDCPADTLLLHGDTFVGGKRTPNRLEAIVEYVASGGGFLMVGGYMSFGGLESKANYRLTPLARILPVAIIPGDDRMECPEGVIPSVVAAEHPVLAGIGRNWPWFLGYNKLEALPDADVLLEARGDPFLAVRNVQSGRTAAFASDCSPHWGSAAFVAWDRYAPFWNQLVAWLAGEGGVEGD